jgi:hypothetical protein
MFEILIIKKIKKYLKDPVIFLYLLKRKIIRLFYELLNFHPTSEPFISGDTIKNVSTYEYKGGALRVNKPEIIFTNTHLLTKLSKQLNSIKYSFILITHLSDHLVDERFLCIINNKKLIHWYAQNCLLKNKKISNVPIGLEDRWRHNNGIIQDFIKLRKKKVNKISRILYSFSVNTNMIKRKLAQQTLDNLSTADYYEGISSHYRKKLINYMFVACPEGNGLDTHRFWEAIYLNVIPITINKNFYSQFENLPILAIDKWEDLITYSEDDLNSLYQKNQHKFKLTRCIWIDYWKKHIKKNFNRNLKNLKNLKKL